MDLRTDREIIINSEEVFSKNCEQSVELDCILPDYYPDIFRLVKCIMVPSIISQSVVGDKIAFEIAVDITLWYCSENSNALNTMTQKLQYSKSIDTGVVCENALVKITPKCDYVNSRAVNRRRLDIRGAVSCNVSVISTKEQNVICDACGCSVQLLKKAHIAAYENSYITKSVVCEDEFDLGSSKPPVMSVVRSEAVVTSIDKKSVSGKIVAKGDISINMLYMSNEDSQKLENMTFSMPFSQILDTNGKESDGEWILDARCISCDITSAANDDDEQKIIKCNVMINITGILQKSREIEYVADAYSTEYPCSVSQGDICMESAPVKINELHTQKETVDMQSHEIESICSVWASAETLSTRIEEAELIISGKVKWNILATSSESYTLFEKESVFEHVMSDFGKYDNVQSDIFSGVISCSYTLSDNRSIALKSDIRLSGYVIPSVYCPALTEILPDTENKNCDESGCALRLYFAQGDEKVWDIAKRYKTCAKAVCEENALEDEDSLCSGMLMIPMVSN